MTVKLIVGSCFGRMWIELPHYGVKQRTLLNMAGCSTRKLFTFLRKPYRSNFVRSLQTKSKKFLKRLHVWNRTASL
jgi:hypothetical protein